MSGESTIIMGTAVYFVLTVIFYLAGYGLKAMGRKKDDIDVFQCSVVLTGVSTWLMWLCAWMQQWHPLIYPISTAKAS
jgi:hypothetical protein